MQRFQIILISVLFLLFFSFCSKDVVDTSDTCPTESYTYDVDVKPIIERNCAYAGCHNGSPAAPGNYSTYDQLLPTLQSNFAIRTLDVRDMPPSYATDGPTEMTQEEINILDCWMKAGFPEN